MSENVQEDQDPEKQASPGSNFFVQKTVEQLAEEQGIAPITDPNKLIGGWPDVVDDGFDEAFARMRRL